MGWAGFVGWRRGVEGLTVFAGVRRRESGFRGLPGLQNQETWGTQSWGGNGQPRDAGHLPSILENMAFGISGLENSFWEGA